MEWTMLIHAPAAPHTFQVYSVKKTARILDVSERTVHRLIKRGDLPSIRIGRRRGVRGDDLAALLDRCRTTHE
jgi:excisionase family DNA binding protein